MMKKSQFLTHQLYGVEQFKVLIISGFLSGDIRVYSPQP